MGGPDLLLGMSYTATADEEIGRIEVFTGEASGTNSVALWVDDPASGSPDSVISSGEWKMSSTDGWQGADLDDCVKLTKGDTVWIVWAPINGSQSSLEEAGDDVTYRGSFDGGAKWNGPFTGPWKYKLFCCD
jgi:hypothetical protein